MANVAKYLAPVKTAFQSRPLQIVLVILGVLAAAWYMGRRAGIQKANESQTELPNNGTQIPVGWKPDPFAEHLYRVMDGLFTTAGTKDQAFSRALDLTDDQLIAVNNAFNRLYLGKGKGTLVNWLQDELYYDRLTGKRDQLLNRLRTLGARFNP